MLFTAISKSEVEIKDVHVKVKVDLVRLRNGRNVNNLDISILNLSNLDEEQRSYLYHHIDDKVKKMLGM